MFVACPFDVRPAFSGMLADSLPQVFSLQENFSYDLLSLRGDFYGEKSHVLSLFVVLTLLASGLMLVPATALGFGNVNVTGTIADHA